MTIPQQEGMTPAEMIRFILFENRITQHELSERLGVTDAKVSAKLRKNSMKASEFQTYAQALGYKGVLLPDTAAAQ